MTTLVLNYSRNLFDVFKPPFKAIGDFLTALGTAVKVSRQIQTNQKLAILLRHEYPHESYNGIVAILNDKTLREYYK